MKAKLGKHAAAFLSTLLLMVAVVAMPGEANAASSIGSVNVSGKTTEYTSVSNLDCRIPGVEIAGFACKRSSMRAIDCLPESPGAGGVTRVEGVL